jgi:hypothetical protein
MFNQKHFYHEHIRKVIIAFGTIFNNIIIRRKNSAGEIAQSLVVPLSYSPKQKILSRVREAADFEAGRAKFQVTLPRIGFEITSLQYDASRKLVPMQTVKSINTDDTGTRFAFVSTPYNIGISMSVFAKNQDDALQIIEQILPYFNPDFNITINELPALGLKRDLQFVLESVNYNDEYAGNFDDRVSVIWDFNFTVKMNFYGYVNRADVIKKTIQSIYNTENLETTDGPGSGVRITTTVTSGTPLDYTFIEEFDEVFLGE